MMVSPKKWLISYNNQLKPLNIVCFPFGGAGASAYRFISNKLSDIAQVWSVQLPGRENRFKEPFAQTYKIAIQEIAADIENLDLNNVVLFGHSMGSDLALAYYEYLNSNALAKPILVVLSGNKPPHIQDDCKWSSASNRDLLEHVVEFGGIPAEAIQDQDFVSLYLDKIRSDYVLYESIGIDRPVVLDPPLVVIYGDCDPILTGIDMSEWSKYTSRDIIMQEVNGGHFYFQNNQDMLIDIFRGALHSYGNSNHITNASKMTPGGAP